MKWMLIIIGGLVLVILIIVVIGALLPQVHRPATRSARFHQTPEAVFALISGPQDWRGVVKTKLPDERGLHRWTEQSGRNIITFEEAACDPPRLYRSRIADRNQPFGGTWTWEIVATDDGCTCRITEDGEVYNPIFRFVSAVIIGHASTIEKYLAAMGQKFHQPIRIEP